MEFEDHLVNAVETEYVAEIGLNHGGDFKMALKLIDAAAESFATSVKFQTYFPEERVHKNSPLWTTLTECMLDVDSLAKCVAHASELGLGFFSAAFGLKSLGLLTELGQDRFKIASFNICNEQLIAAASERGEVILATGTSSASEILRADSLLGPDKSKHIFLHCISAYPTSTDQAALSNIGWLKSNTRRRIGFSDHTVGADAAAGACLLGAVMIEKHFTLDKSMAGPDHFMSSDPTEFKEMVNRCTRSSNMLGSPRGDTMYECEADAAEFRRETTENH